jgi:hypothetical protein
MAVAEAFACFIASLAAVFACFIAAALAAVFALALPPPPLRCFAWANAFFAARTSCACLIAASFAAFSAANLASASALAFALAAAAAAPKGGGGIIFTGDIIFKGNQKYAGIFLNNTNNNLLF